MSSPSDPGSEKGVRRSSRQSGLFKDRIVGLRRVPACDLLPNPRRWRRHPQAQSTALKAMLQEVGWADACLARQTDSGLVLIDGHLRQELGADALVPVLVLDLEEEEGESLLATLDPLAGMSEADEKALQALLASARIADAALRAHVQSLLPGPPRRGRCDPDDIPSVPSEPLVQPGELWAMGKHRLLCGDATRPEDLERVLGGSPADVMWTDPPYGVSYVGKTRDRLIITNDSARGIERFLGAAFGAIDSVLRPGAALYVAHPAGGLSVSFAGAFLGAGWRLHQTLVWVKDRMVLGHADYHYRHEPILYGYKPGPGRWGRGHQGWYGGNDQDSVLEVPRPAASPDHPTAKPVELIASCLSNSSAPGEIVVDPFAGSGSTLIACQQLGRMALLVEIDPKYCQVILDRWAAFSGEQAVKVDG